MRIRFSTVVLCCLLWPLNVMAETVYVNDNLRVGVRTEPNNNIAPIGVVTTGMKLDVLERSDGYIRIRTEQDVEGWIKDIYVTEERPATLVLAELRQQQEKLAAELGKKDQLVKSAESTAASLSKEVDNLKNANSELRMQLMKARQAAGELGAGSLFWLGIGFVFIAGGAFAAGVLWHRQRAMKRLGGLRV